jgi:hypothetical protein
VARNPDDLHRHRRQYVGQRHDQDLPVLIGIFGAYIVASIVTAFGPQWVDFSGLKVNSISDVISVPRSSSRNLISARC